MKSLNPKVNTKEEDWYRLCIKIDGKIIKQSTSHGGTKGQNYCMELVDLFNNTFLDSQVYAYVEHQHESISKTEWTPV